jgi:hypothetical protein
MSGDLDDGFRAVLNRVLPFAATLKADMVRQDIAKGRRRCPEEHDDGQVHYVHARRQRGGRGHMHMACDDPKCCMRLME